MSAFSRLAMGLDPSLLLRQADVQPDPWQAEVLRSDAPRQLLNCSRQSGKSTTAAALGLHTALYQPGAVVLVVSPGERQSQLLYRRMLELYRALGEPVASLVENKLSLELRNGSQVHALPGKEGTIRGFSNVALLLVDEAARVPDDTYAAVQPMLAVSGGTLVALSTPYGKRGWWYEAWTHGGPTWRRVEVPATEVPRISPAFLEEERLALGERTYREEYGCEFLDPKGAVFSEEIISAARVAGGRMLFPGGVRRG